MDLLSMSSCSSVDRAPVQCSGGHCLVSNREGLGTSLKIMGLATIDSHSQKEHTEIHKIPKFGVKEARKGFSLLHCL